MMKLLPAGSWHKKHAKMGAYGAWEMPIWYESAVQEHVAVRNRVGVFDVSHMGEILVTGDDALRFLQWVTTNDIEKPPPISGTYALILNERGAIKDETLIYNMGSGTYMIVCDAVAVEKVMAHLRMVLATINTFGKADVSLENKTDEMCLYSIQGPRASELCTGLFGIDIDAMWWFQAQRTAYRGIELIVSKSGYTGENGFELFFEHGSKAMALQIWEDILQKGAHYGIVPCGLGARDSLRMEAGYTLYGQDTTEHMSLSTDIDHVTPIEAGLSFALYMEKEFIGKDALVLQKQRGVGQRLVHLLIDDKVIARAGDELVCNGAAVGTVTSGTKSPVLHKSIALGLLDSSCVQKDVGIRVRGKVHAAHIITPPFYNPKEYGAYREG